ncbi:hypothetical protein E2320_010773 [Naja naja]|nr:hypothetical protein E2320_010773 [Naja naja]
MASVSVMGFAVSRLNLTNYHSWSVKMEMYLRREELWTIVINPPAVLDNGDWRRNEKALANINSGFGGQSADTHEGRMAFTEAHKVYVVLSSLDTSWDILVTSLESMQERDLTMMYLTGRLLEEEQKSTTATSQDISRAAETVYTVKCCFTCGSTELLQRCCLERRNRGATRQGCRATQYMWGGSSSSFSLAATLPENTRNSWLLDSGVSQHFPNNPQMFSGLSPSKQTFVSLAIGQ